MLGFRGSNHEYIQNKNSYGRPAVFKCGSPSTLMPTTYKLFIYGNIVKCNQVGNIFALNLFMVNLNISKNKEVVCREKENSKYHYLSTCKINHIDISRLTISFQRGRYTSSFALQKKKNVRETK